MPVNRFKNYSPNKPHLVRPGGLKGEVQDLRKDLDDWSIEVSNAIDAGTGGITELTGDVTTAVGTGSQAATVEGLQGNPVSAAAPSVSDVLTWSGTEWAPAAGGGGGTIGGTIAANEIAFGTGVDSIGGSAQLEWNAGTGVLTVSDAAVTPVLTVDTANAAVDLSVDELRLAGSPGAAGEVLTSNGPGVAPTWQAGGGGGLWSKTGTELSPATAGDTVQIEIAVGTAGLTVEDTPASLMSEVRPGVLYLTDNVKVAELNTVSASLLLKGDSGEAIPVIPTITAQDYDSSPTPLNLVIEELQLNANPGNLGDVLTSNGPGAAPTWGSSPYTATTPADWAAPAPTTVQEAIDRLAAAVAGLLSTPVP